MTPLITPAEEPHVRLMMFGAALLAIATRNPVQFTQDGEHLLLIPPRPPVPEAIDEARAIADAFIAEAQRISQPNPAPTGEQT